jgi:hypothetical protein
MDSLNADISNGICYMKIGSVWSAITTAAIKMNVTYGADLNLPNGTIFITSDTNVHYMWNGTDTWNEVA